MESVHAMNAQDMHWYALQCISGREEALRHRLTSDGVNVFVPQRKLRIRRSGRWLDEVKPLFPGYIFFSSKKRVLYNEILELVERINRSATLGRVVQVLGLLKEEGSSGSDMVIPVAPHEIDFLLSLTGGEDVIPLSSYIKEGQGVRIIEGPLKGLEAMVTRVNHRKNRIKVALEMFGHNHSIDLGAQMVTA